jgi:hypothetical protein
MSMAGKKDLVVAGPEIEGQPPPEADPGFTPR